MHGASNRDTHFYPPHNNSSVHPTTTPSAALGADHRWNAESVKTLRDTVLSPPSHPPGMALPRTAWVRLNRLAPMSDVSGPVCTNRVWPPLWVWHRTNCRPCCLPMSNPSTSQWTAPPGRDNRMAAQHLPQDLVLPSSGLKELAQAIKKQLVLACCRHSHLNQPRAFVCVEHTSVILKTSVFSSTAFPPCNKSPPLEG